MMSLKCDLAQGCSLRAIRNATGSVSGVMCQEGVVYKWERHGVEYNNNG